METIEQLTSRFKALKQAVLQEKEKRKETTSAVESLKSKIRSKDDQAESISIILDKKTKEKESLEEELKKLQEQLKLAKQKANPLKKSFGSSKSIIALQAQNEKLIEEYSTLQTDHREDELSISRLKEEYNLDTEKLNLIIKEIAEINENCSKKQENEFLEIKRKKDEIEFIVFQNQRVKEKNSEIEEEIERTNRKNIRLAQDFDSIKNFVMGKVEIKNKMVDSLKIHEKNEMELMNSVQEAKNELFNSKSFYQEFSVRVACLITQSEGKLVFRKSEENEHIVEIIYKGKIETVYVKLIEDVYEHLNKKDRVVIKYKSKTKEIISDDKDTIILRLRELMQRCGKRI